MSKTDIAEVSMERCPQNMPYEILFEIFRNLPKDKLIKASRLCSKFKDVAGDTRLWKNVHIKYEPNISHYDFEELYSEPWPVALIDLSETQINPPVSLQTDQVVKVAKLNLSSIRATVVTTEAILAKYQCTKLLLNFRCFAFQYCKFGIAPEAFSKQTALEVLSIRCVDFVDNFGEEKGLWLKQVLSNCKNLKTLDFGITDLRPLDMSGFAKHLPGSLEKLIIGKVSSEDSFFESFAERIPNLKELGICYLSRIKCLSVLEFQFLEALHITVRGDQEVGGLLIASVKTTKFHAISNVKLLAPITKPDKVLCIGLNYKEHCDEQNVPYPKEPLVFSKFSSTITGPYDNIEKPLHSDALDWEGELAIVIGKKAKHVKIENAMDHVLGYTVAQDITARDWYVNQRNGGQVLLSKSMDTFCPLGPYVVTQDEIKDKVHNLKLKTWVNGVLKQDGVTSELIHRVDKLIVYLSSLMTLFPGDVILTGTPSGVGYHRNPPEKLVQGDLLETEIEGIGKLSNKVV